MITAMEIIWSSIKGSANWFIRSVTFDVPWYQNFFWGLILISALVYSLELLFPWRKNQKPIRKDFWLDLFYMFFNFFAFSIAISGIYSLLGELFSTIGIQYNSIQLIDLSGLSIFWSLLIFFVLLDFVQWLTHIALHRFEALWKFHQIHHSVKEMGFAAHMRYHWMENILYKPLKTIGVMLLGGFEPEQAYIVHFVAISIGHLNHANLKLDYGILRYVFNNPIMHLYHHAYHLPKEKNQGVNYGISLSVWDYLFGTNYIPDQNGSIELGFPGDEHVPEGFGKQFVHGFKSKNP
jgi:sterol desaturase/sphingolipid hydroxylase (fatty acid hydroxylase superfamily)